METTLSPANHITPDENFVEDSVKELPQWLQDKENYTKLVRWYAKRWDTLDKEAIKLAYTRLLDNSGGKVLDTLGEKLGLYRYNQTDGEYKSLIKLRAFRQTQGDTRPDIVKLSKILFFGDAPIINKRKPPQVINIANTTTILDTYPYLHSSFEGKSWEKPEGVGVGEKIVSVDETSPEVYLLTTTSGQYTTPLVEVFDVPNSNSFIEVTIPANCLSDIDVANQLEDIFPVNTYLWVFRNSVDIKPFYLVDGKTMVQPSGTGGLSDSKDAIPNSALTKWIHSSARPVRNT